MPMLCTALLLAAGLSFVAPVTNAETPPAAATPESKRPNGLRFAPTLRLNLRGEALTNDGADSWQVVETVRAGLNANYRELGVVAQFQDVRAWGQGGILSENPFTGLHQGYIEVAGKANRLVSGYVRVGRQEIVYGSLRHFHKSPWHPAGRAFDAARGHLDIARASIELSYMLADRPQEFTIAEPDDSERRIRGRGDHLAYADIGYDFHAAAQLHAAVIVQRLGAQPDDPSRGRFFWMPGGRLTGKVADGVDYEAEFWLQRGRDRGRDMRAWMAAGAVGYVAPIAAHPGARLHYEAHSGSACTGDPTAGEACGDAEYRDFDQLDGARHKYRGWMDLFAGSNLRDLAASVFASPSPTVKATAAYHFLQLHEASGRFYNISGEATWGAGWDPTNTRRTLGHEIDLLVEYRPWKYLTIRPGYSVFIKGPAAKRLLSPEAMHYVYVWLVAEF